SDPTAAAMPSRSAAGKLFRTARSSPSKAATAFDEAPPIPPCTGNRFSISIRTRPFTRRASTASSTTRKQVLVRSRGTRGSAQRIIPLPQIVVIPVEVQRQQINRDRIGEGRLEILVLEAFGVRAVARRQLASVPGVEGSFSTNARLHLFPCQFAEIPGDAGAL